MSLFISMDSPVLNRKIIVCFLLAVNSLCLISQNFIPGETYYDSTGFVEYRAGNLPIILSAPHGGALKPDSIPDRSFGVLGADLRTQELTVELYQKYFEDTGCYPHMITNLLHRSKFDANRAIEEAADGNPLVEQSWYAYHRFIDTAKTSVINDFNRGLFIDMHGHSHTIPRIELGYTLSGSELRLGDESLNVLLQETSIRSLAIDNPKDLTLAELLRGQFSMGTLLHDEGFPSVPSSQDLFPLEGQAYFSGGYNTQRHGSRENLGPIDAIQFEFNREIRVDQGKREMLTAALVTVIKGYMDTHYGINYCGNADYDGDGYTQNEDCDDTNSDINPMAEEVPNNGVDEDCDGADLISSVNENSIADLHIFPNPASDHLNLSVHGFRYQISIFDSFGNKILSSNTIPIDIRDLPPGTYMLHLRGDDYSVDNWYRFVKISP